MKGCAGRLCGDGPIDRKRERLAVEAADNVKLIGRDDRGGVAGQCGGIGREVAE